MPPTPSALERIGVGIDTARFSHRVSFMRPDHQPAAKPLTVLESRAGYTALQQRLEQLRQQHPQAHFHIRIDAAGQPATLAAVRYPGGTPAPAVPGSDEKAMVYEHEVKLAARLRLDAQALPGPLTLKLTVAYQACNDRACLAPASLTVPLAAL